MISLAHAAIALALIAAEEPKSTDWTQANMAVVMCVFVAVSLGLTWLIYWETKHAPIRAVKVAAAAASAEAMKKEQLQLLVGMMRHLFDLAAAAQALSIAMEAKGNAWTPEAGASVTQVVVSAQRQHDLAEGAIRTDLRLLDILFDRDDERLAGVKRHVGDWVRGHGPDERWSPTVERAAGTCGVIADTIRMLGFSATTRGKADSSGTS